VTIDSSIVTAIIAGVISLLTVIITRFFARRGEDAKAHVDEGDAAVKLSAAAAQQVQIYSDEIVEPLRKRIDALEQENLDLSTRAKTVEALQRRIDVLEGENLGLAQRLDVVEKENKSLIEVRRTYDLQVENFRVQVRSLGKSLDSQRQQIAILIEQGMAKDKTIKIMQGEIQQLQVENEALRHEIMDLRNENNQLRGIADE
jgi:septal ring factor EnvC (AmiA/AmiB activator)